MDVRSNEPFWLLKNGLLQSYPSLANDLDCEVVIVGGGITGALMAHACIEAGHETVLIDKREIANGSTAATTSMLQYEIDVPLHKLAAHIGDWGATAAYRGCRGAIDTLSEIVEATGSCCGFARKESLYFTGRKRDTEWLKTELEARRAAGFHVRWMTGDEIREQFGLFALCGILSAEGGSVDAFHLTHDLLQWNIAKGLRVFDRTECGQAVEEGGILTLPTGTGSRIRAKTAIYCTGYESQAMLPEKVVELKSTYACVSERNEAWAEPLVDTLFWNTDSPYLYLRSTDDGRMLVGGEDVLFKNPYRRDMLLPKKAKKLAEHFRLLFPEAEFKADFAWCGTFGETADGLPYIGPHPRFPNSYFVLGFGGNGITFSVMAMQIIMAMMRGQTPKVAHYFRFGR